MHNGLVVNALRKAAVSTQENVQNPEELRETRGNGARAPRVYQTTKQSRLEQRKTAPYF
jgi:hypothetical protein